MVNQLPQGWKEEELGKLADVSSGDSAPQSSSCFLNGSYPFCRTSDVGKIHRSSNFSEIEDYINETAISKLHLFHRGTILFPKSGASTLLNHRVMLSIDSYVSSHLATIYANSIDRYYLYYFLCTVDAKQLVPNLDYPSLKISELKNIKVPYPTDKGEQDYIVKTLDAVAEIIRLRKETIQLAKELNDCRFFETDKEFEFNAYLNTLEADKQKQLNKIVYDVLNKAFAHKMKSFPSKFKKKLSGIFSDITPKQFFNLNYFDAHEHRCCLCGRLLDHDAKELPVAEIEHLFPQSKFPQLILCISNYIPCCSNCNKIKKSSFFSCKKEFIEDLQKLGKSFHHPLFFWKLFDANFDYNLPAVKKCDIVQYYKINERFNQIRHYMYSNLFNLVKYHNIETPEALESFLESCQNANMQEMVSDFSLNNHPKLWHDFIDYVLYDYNNLTALWEEIKEYNKLKYYC